MVDGRAAVAQIREVDVTDLLGRDAVAPAAALFLRNIRGKVVMVTGAGGSIGSELCRQILSQRPARLVLIDHSEFSLYSIEHELVNAGHGTPVVACLGSVLDEPLLRGLMQREKGQTAHHAAACPSSRPMCSRACATTCLARSLWPGRPTRPASRPAC